MVTFPPFKLDPEEERLWKGTQLVTVRRKPFAILKYLVANPRRLVTHAELLEHVWGGMAVSESTVRTQLHELRQILGEGVIETVIGRGYRFAAAIVDDAQVAERKPPATTRIVVGRGAEIDALGAALERANAGQRQVCFVTGEPGIGKTTLVDTFLDELPAGVSYARGHCIEQRGTPEPYLALIEILRTLRQSEHGADTLAAFLRYAPMFLAQLPQLVPADQFDEVVRRARGGSEARMVRELVEAMEDLCTDRTLVIVLEDLQWSDVATIDLLSLIGTRRERARMLVIATSRRDEANTVSHPLNRVMRTLVARHGALAVPLDRVAIADIDRLLELRFGEHAFPSGLVGALDRITAGTPMFLVSVVDDLVARGMLAKRDERWSLTASIDEVAAHRPDNIKQLIDIRVDRLEVTEQRVLEAASVVGAEFSSELVATALEKPIEEVDEICDGLARRAQFLRRESSELWPDGTEQTRYGVTHAFVQEVCLDRIPMSRRQRWHRLIAVRLETAFGERVVEIAHTLAMHFERAGAIERAIHYSVLAAERTAQRFASRDAMLLFRRGHALLERVSASPERDAHELRLLAGVVASTLRTSDPDDETLARLERMTVLARQLDDAQRLCATLLNLMFRHQLAAEHVRVSEIAAQVDALIASSNMHPALVAFAQSMTALSRLWSGNLDGVVAAFEALTETQHTLEEPLLAILGPTDRRTVLNVYLSTARWLLGEPDRALAVAERALAQAQSTNDPFALGLARCNLAWLRIVRGDPDADVRAAAQPVLELPTEVWHPTATILAAWAQPIDAAGADRLVRELRHMMTPLGTTRLALAVIGTLRRSGHTAHASTVITEMLAFARERGEQIALAELLRLQAQP